MAFYTLSRQNVTPTNGNDLVTLVAAANRRLRVVKCSVTAAGTASGTQNLVQLVRATTAGVTGGGAITPQAVAADMPAAAFTANTTWSTQPVLPANGGALFQLASNGAIRSESWFPEQAIEARNAENISLRSVSGSTAVSFDLEIEEV